MKNPDQKNSSWELKNFWIARRCVLLTLGFILILLYDMRGSADIFAWFMPLPFLIYVALYKGVKNHIWLLLSLVTGFILMLAKTASDPVFASVGFSIMMGMVIGIRYFLVFLLWSYIRRFTGKLISIISFPAIIMSMEYLQAFYLPFGDWGSLANTQLYNLPLLQTASLFGFVGISALMAWAAVLMATLALSGKLAGNVTQLISFLIIFTTLNVWGDLRLNKVPDGKHITAAALMVDNEFTGTLPDPHDPAVVATTKLLIDNTRKAALSGARVAVWGEGSTLIAAEDEQDLMKDLAYLARTHNISIVAAYVVPPTKEGEKFQNKFTWILNNGKIGETYHKHHPVPGEGSIKGVEPINVLHTEYGNMSGAICYDYDFPNLALTQARLGADLILLPGMDWRNMLQRHTLMARVRAIEGGFSLLRAANGATSMGFDKYGRILASMSDFGDNDKILLASLPVKRTNTLYSYVGNLLAYIALAVFLATIIMAARNILKARKGEKV